LKRIEDDSCSQRGMMMSDELFNWSRSEKKLACTHKAKLLFIFISA